MIICLHLHRIFLLERCALCQSLILHPMIALADWLWLTFVILGFIVGHSVTCCTKSILNSLFTSGLQKESRQNRPFPLDFPLHLQNETFSLILFLIISLYDQSRSPDIHIPDPFNHSSLVLSLKLMPPVTY